MIDQSSYLNHLHQTIPPIKIPQSTLLAVKRSRAGVGESVRPNEDESKKFIGAVRHHRTGTVNAENGTGPETATCVKPKTRK